MINRKVFLVAGHDIDGDPGAVFGAYRENYETVQITDLTAKILRDHGLEVIVDPHTNDMYQSVNYINARCSGIDDGIVIDIHKNSFSQPAYGFETWIMRTDDPETVRLGNLIQYESIRATGLVNRGVKKENWYVITNANCRGVLVECGFINADPNTDEYDYKYALGIAKGVLSFFGIPYKEPVTTKPVPEASLIPKKTVITKLQPTYLWDLTTNPNFVSVKSFAKGEEIDVVAEIKFNGATYYQTVWSFGRNKWGVNSVDVIDKPAPEPTPEPETPTEPSTPDYDKENNTLLKLILDLLNKLIEKIGGIFR